MRNRLGPGDSLASGTCGRCHQRFAAVQRKGQQPSRDCPRCVEPPRRRTLTRRAAEPRRAVVADARRDRVLNRLRAPRDDMPGLHDLARWQHTTCVRTWCGKPVFPTLERAMVQACLYAASLGKRVVPLFVHGRWHLATTLKRRQGPVARARQQRARKARQRAAAEQADRANTPGTTAHLAHAQELL